MRSWTKGYAIIEWKITPSYRLGLLAGVAAVALLSSEPAFAITCGTNTQTVTQTGINDSETQVQQAGVTCSTQYVTQSTHNASPVPLQSYQLQTTGTANNTQKVYQHDYSGYYGGNSVQQKQASNGNYMYAKQDGKNNKIIQYQNGGGGNSARVGESGNAQYGAGNYIKQTQLGLDERTNTFYVYGNYNSSTQFQNFTGTSKSNQYVFQEGDNNIAVQNQYSNAYQKINQDKNVPKGYGNNAN